MYGGGGYEVVGGKKTPTWFLHIFFSAWVRGLMRNDSCRGSEGPMATSTKFC